MKKTMVSLAAASLIVTSAMAADKGIDIVTTGQAVVYYETHQDNGTGSKDMFTENTSNANVGVQLNLDADLKNNFTFGSQLTYLGTAGLEKNLVDAEKQSGLNGTSTTDALALTKIFIAKKVGNTTVKMGRQELPKSLSPFAYSEGWNVFKNTFDAILAVNTDIPDTTVVAAYVSGGTGMNLATTGNLTPSVGGLTSPIGNVQVDGAAYMLTVQNKSIPMTTVTATYYSVADVNADSNGTVPTTAVPNPAYGDRAVETGGANAIWLDASVAGKDLPMGLKVGLQGGQLSSDLSGISDTVAIGAQVSLAPIDALTLALAYTSVDGDDNKANIAVKNFGTGIKSPLYTQMIYNQDAIALDANTFMVKAAYNTGDFGKIIAQYAGTTAGKSNLMNSGRDATGTDYNEFDLIYKVKAGGVQYFAAFINRSWSKETATKQDADNKLRFWARYNF